MAGATARIAIIGDTKQLRAALAQAEGQIATFSGKMRRMGDGLVSTGRSLTTGLTLPLVALGVGAAKASISFESAFAGVIKTVNATESELAMLRKGIIDMANEIPASREEIAAVAEAAGQLGIQTGNILDFTRVMIDLGETTNLSATEAATALARLANITQMPQSEFDRLGATIVELGNNLATTEAEIVEMGLRLAGAGKQIGLTEAEILGFAGALTSVGVEAEAGGTAFSRVFLDIQQSVMKGGRSLDNFAEIAGMSADNFAKAFRDDPAQAIATFIEGLGRIQAEGGNVAGALEEVGFGQLRVRDSMLRTAGAGDLVAESLRMATGAWEENSALTNEAEQRYKTSAAQLEVLKNRVTDVARQFGDVLVPVMLRLLDAASPLLYAVEALAKGFGALPVPIQTVIVGIGGIAAAVGPTMWVFGKLLQVGASVIEGFEKLALKAYDAAGGVDRIGGAFRNSMGSIGMFALKLGAVVGVAALAIEGLKKIHDANAQTRFPTHDAERYGVALQAIAETGTLIGVLEQDWNSLSDAVDKNGETAKGFFAYVTPGLNEAITGTTANIRAAEQQVEAYDQALLTMHRQNAPLAAEAFEHIRQRLLAQGRSVEEVDAAFNDYRGAVNDAAAATEAGVPPVDALGGAQDEAAAATENHEEALKSLSDTLSAQFDPLFGMVDALQANKEAGDAVTAAQWKLLEAQARGEEGAWDAAAAQEELEQAQLNSAKSAIDMEKAVKDLTGAVENKSVSVETARGMLDRWVAMGWITQDAANAVAAKFQEVTTKANEIPPIKNTTVTADTSDAMAKLSDLHAYINQVTGQGIVVKGPNLGQIVVTPKALGGPVTAQQAYLVGERGPELFVPDYSGQIIPNNELSKNNNPTPVSTQPQTLVEHIHVHVDGKEIASTIRRRELARR
jgi:TP901 family phage tail tape measure protein